MNYDELRLACLKLAHGVQPGEADDVVKRARIYADFALGTANGMQSQPATPESEADPRNPNV